MFYHFEQLRLKIKTISFVPINGIKMECGEKNKWEDIHYSNELKMSLSSDKRNNCATSLIGLAH